MGYLFPINSSYVLTCHSQEAPPALKDQHELIKVLESERDGNEKRHQRMLAAIADRTYQDGVKRSVDLSAPSDRSHTPPFAPMSIASTIITPDPQASTSEATTKQPTKKIILPNIVLPAGIRRHHERIHHHSYLVQNFLSKIASLE